MTRPTVAPHVQAMLNQLGEQALPASLGDVPKLRYWGGSRPPKNYATNKVRTALATSPTAAAEPGTPAPVDEQADVTSATIRLYGPIDSWGGWWGISAEDVSVAIDALPSTVTELQVRVNSPGGEVWEALTILNMLRAHAARVTAVVDGLAASAGSVIAVGCDETVMSPGTQMMIHDASTFAYGNPADMKKAAKFLDSVSNSIAELYVEAAEGTVAGWRSLMGKETWYTAQEAASAGLAARVGVVPDLAVSTTPTEDPAEPDPLGDDPLEDSFDLSIYNHAGRTDAPAPKPPAASADGSTPEGEGGSAVAFSDEQITDLRKKLGIAEDADEATILAALDEALAEQAAEPTPQPTSRVHVPEGMQLIDSTVLSQLQEQGQAGVDARARQMTEDRDRALQNALQEGRITSASRDTWAKRYDADPVGTAELIETLPKGVVPTEELGHANPSNKSGDDALFGAVMSGHIPQEA